MNLSLFVSIVCVFVPSLTWATQKPKCDQILGPAGAERLSLPTALGKPADVYRKEQAAIRQLPKFRMLRALYQFAVDYEDRRLTNRESHSEDVARIARELSRQMGLGEASGELAATIGLAHDIGHPVFSHWGEVAIQNSLRPYGGHWDHDAAGLRVITEWAPVPIQLRPETYGGIAKRFWRSAHVEKFNHLEGQLAAQADRIAFNGSDVQDGLRVGRLTTQDLREHFPSAYATYLGILRDLKIAFDKTAPKLSFARWRAIIEADPIARDFVYAKFSERFREFLMRDLIATTTKNISKNRPADASHILFAEELTADFSEGLKSEFRGFANFCRDRIFANSTAPYLKIAERAIEFILSGKLKMSEPFAKEFSLASAELEKRLIIARYLTIGTHDVELLATIRRLDPEFYVANVPKFEDIGVSPTKQDGASFLTRVRELAMRRAHVAEISPDGPATIRYATTFARTGRNPDPLDPNEPLTIPAAKSYSPERRAMHARIVANALAGKVADGATRSFVMVSGGMSVGMTYMQRLLLEQGALDLSRTVVITPQTFVEMPEFRARSHYQHPEKSPLLVREYYDISRKILRAAIHAGLDVLYVDQADDSAKILSFADMAKSSGYATAMVGLTMSPKNYFAASQLWLTRFHRLPDHARGFGDLREFARAWPLYTRAFDQALVFETKFHVEDIDRDASDLLRREYSIKAIAATAQEGGASSVCTVMNVVAYDGFLRRATGQAEAAEELNVSGDRCPIPKFVGSRLADRLNNFFDGDFERRFLELVRRTTEERASRAKQLRKHRAGAFHAESDE